MKRLLIFVLYALCSSAFGQQCKPGTTNGVTLLCHMTYSVHGSPLIGEPTLNYDLYYPTAAGVNNALPIIVYLHYGAYRAMIDKENHGAPVFSMLAASGYNVYVMEYSLTAMGLLWKPIAPGQSTILVARDGGNFFPPAVNVHYTIRIDNEVKVVTSQWYYQKGNNPIWYLGLRHPTTSSHGKAFVYVLGTQWPRPGNDGARFLAFLGHNAGKGTGVPGNPHDIHIWGFSAGSHLALELAMTGSALFLNDGEFSLADFQNAKITRVVASSPPADEGCVTRLATDGSEPNAVASLIGGVPTAQTVSSVDCAATGQNSWYTLAWQDSPVAWATSTNPAIPTLIQTGSLDTDVTPAPAKEFMELTVGNPNIHQTIYEGLGHLLDVYPNNRLFMSTKSLAVQEMAGFLQ
jgi:acetyl esterase/lipase